MNNPALSLADRLPAEVVPHLQWTKDNRLNNNANNWHAILSRDPRLAGRLMYNEFARKPFLDGREINGHAITALQLWMSRNYFISPPTKPFEAVVSYAAQTNGGFDPLRDYITALPAWDTTERIDSFLIEAAKAADTPLVRRISRCFFLSCIQRALNPGCKVDTVLILQGKQRQKKSTAVEALCPKREWFSSSQANLKIGDRDAVYCIQGKWLFEIAELDSFRGKKQTQLKAFFSEKVDRVRPLHSNFYEDLPRRTIFVGTTNESAFLRDSTGSRRYHPVEVGMFDIPYIIENRDQLWAEAYAAVLAGEQHWFTDDEEDSLAAHNEAYQEVDPWEEPISEFMSEVCCPTMNDVLTLALRLKPKEADKRSQLRAAAILRRLGYKSKQTRSNGVHRQVWVEDK